MALRTFFRLLALALPTAPLTFLLWDVTGPLPLLAGLGLLALVLGHLALLAGGQNVTRWQLRYQLGPRDGTDRLEELLRFLVQRTSHFVLEADARGLFLELPPAFDRYVEAQFPRALSELKLSKADGPAAPLTGGAFFLSVGPLSSDLLRWATEGEGRQVRLHVHQGPYATVLARTDSDRPPGRWLRLRMPRRFWQRWPLWDELSAGISLSSLFPQAGDGAPYSSRSRLLQLVPPEDYIPDLAGRSLGQSIDGRPLTLSHAISLFTVGAPPPFLVRQALDDLEVGRTVVVLSPHRRVLEQIARGASEVPTHWLDTRESRRSAHLAIVSAEEWETVEIDKVVDVAQTFLADLGVNVDLPAVGGFTHRLLRALAELARDTGQDLTFTDLYAVSQSTQALRAFLSGAPGEMARGLLAQLDDDGGYVQAVTVLSAIRTALKPLEAGALNALCQPPFLSFRQLLNEKALILVPMTNDDFPEQDRLLSAMLDLSLNRVLTSGEYMALSLHLHDPHLYRRDEGRRWIDLAPDDARLSLLLDVHDPGVYSQILDGQKAAQVVFRFPESLASGLVAKWGLPASAAELRELPAGTAIARLPGMVVALKVGQ
jgi:hypothetical protein